jgi:hypothetical protein
MKCKISLLTLFVVLLSGFALAQNILPEPTLIDHQIVTNVGHNTFTATESIQTTYNLVYISVTCGWYGTGLYEPPCVGVGGLSDTSGATWHLVERHYNTNTNYDFTQEEWYAIVGSTGTDTITLATGYSCSTCTWYAMAEQINGIEADD